MEWDEKLHLVSMGLAPIQEAAFFLGVKRVKIYELIRKGVLISVKIGKSRRIPRMALVEFAASQLPESEEDPKQHGCPIDFSEIDPEAREGQNEEINC